MEVNEAFEKLGFMKKWQVFNFCMVVCILLPNSIISKFTFTFSGYIPKHHCKIPDNSSLVHWIPKDENGNFDSCSMFVNVSLSNKTVPCHDGWEYEDQDCGLTIVNEWDLVCDKAYYAGFTHVMYLVGEMIAFYLVGLADIFGRKPISLLFLFLLSFTGVLNSFAGSYTVYILENVLLGVFTVPAGIYSTFLSEITSNKNRDFVGSISYICWGVYGTLTIIIFYFFKNWRYFKFSTNIYGLVMLPFLILFLPESVYWLHANNRIKEAEEILIRAGKLNNVQFISPILIPPKIKDSFIEDKTDLKKRKFFENMKTKFLYIFEKMFSSNTSLHTQYSIKELYRNKYLFRHMFFGLFLFFKIINSSGILFASPILSPHLYLNTFFSTVVEIPSAFAGWFISNKYSLRKAMVICMLLTTLFTILVPVLLVFADTLVTNYTTIILSSLARFTGSLTWAFIYSYQSTLFPTNLRSRGVGICFIFSRIGIMPASYLPYVMTIHPIGTYIFLAVCALISVLILLFLPDTKSIFLPETIEDIEKLYKNNENTEKMKLLEKSNDTPDEFDDEEQKNNE